MVLKLGAGYMDRALPKSQIKDLLYKYEENDWSQMQNNMLLLTLMNKSYVKERKNILL